MISIIFLISLSFLSFFLCVCFFSACGVVCSVVWCVVWNVVCSVVCSVQCGV